MEPTAEATQRVANEGVRFFWLFPEVTLLWDTTEDE
jgi:hypothetical protein